MAEDPQQDPRFACLADGATKPEFEEPAPELSAELGPADPDTLLLQNIAHGLSQGSTLSPRELRANPSEHRPIAVLILVELELIGRHGRHPSTALCHSSSNRTPSCPVPASSCNNSASVPLRDARFSQGSRGLGHLRVRPENPRVGGSIPPPGTLPSPNIRAPPSAKAWWGSLFVALPCSLHVTPHPDARRAVFANGTSGKPRYSASSAATTSRATGAPRGGW